LNKRYKTETVATDLNNKGVVWNQGPIGGKKTRKRIKN